MLLDGTYSAVIHSIDSPKTRAYTAFPEITPMSNRLLSFLLVASFAFATLSLAQMPAKITQPKLTPQNSGTTEGIDCRESGER